MFYNMHNINKYKGGMVGNFKNILDKISSSCSMLLGDGHLGWQRSDLAAGNLARLDHIGKKIL